MAKRFIDTGLFDDEWFMDISKDAKILWLYLITKCDHAGIIKLNLKLCKVQTGINDLETVRQQLGNRLVTVGEQLFFIPKFVMYQYPGFPDCKFNMAKSAIAILEKYELIENGILTVPEQLGNCTGNGNGNSNGNGIVKEEAKLDFEIFWNLYDKKVGAKDNCKKKWDRLTLETQQRILDFLPQYLPTIKDKQFQPYPETWLNQKRWENEIIPEDNRRVIGGYYE